MGRSTGRLALTAAVILASLATASPAIAQAAAHGTQVGPGQHFRGRVNGHTGRRAPVVITMACYGPIQPGKTGHPMAGQTIGLFLVDSGGHGAGRTGPQTTSVGAFFDTLPPSGAPPAAQSWVDFTQYGTRALPTSLTLPCSGPGTVYFVPLPTVGGRGRLAKVPVSYVGQP